MVTQSSVGLQSGYTRLRHTTYGSLSSSRFPSRPSLTRAFLSFVPEYSDDTISLILPSAVATFDIADVSAVLILVGDRFLRGVTHKTQQI